MHLLCVLLLFLSAGILDAGCVALRSRDAGMFSIFCDVLSLVQGYEKGIHSYATVDFETTGLYYDPARSPNWWTYYFKPIQLGNRVGTPRIIYGLQGGVDPWDIETRTSKEEVNRLINKFVRVKNEIRRDVKTFFRVHFQGHFMIGVHYRGTDKKIEAPRVPYETVIQAIQDVVDKLENKDKDYKIFVATDEQGFLDYIQSVFVDKVCWIKETKRSTQGVALHLDPTNNPYLSGKYALLDCLLLSKTNFLIRTDSNLSKASTYFNPRIPVVELNHRFSN